MIVFDFEVFKYDWLVVFKNIINNEIEIIHNDDNKLETYYRDNKDELFIGFNNANYDNYILKSILMGKDPYYISGNIIGSSNNAILHRLANWNEIQFTSYDVSYGLGFSSLKENEAYLGMDIRECPVSFQLDRPLNSDELDQVKQYCIHDVEATEILFERTRDKFETKLYLCHEFNLDKSYLNKGNETIIAKVLGAEKRVKFNDENEPFDFNQLDLRISKYKSVVDYFSLPVNEQKGLTIEIAGVEHSFGIGGIHGARNNFSHVGELMILDVEAYYPSLMIAYNWFSRAIPNSHKKLYAKIKADRVKLKKTNPKLSGAYKLVQNTTYGCYKYQYGNLYDPRMANNICIGGQVLLVDLIEQCEPYSILVQSNTDGIILIPTDKEKLLEVVADWERRTLMKLEITYGDKIVQKDVNNYVFRKSNGEIKCVGGYVGQYKSDKVRKTLSVVDEALVEYLMNDISIEYTITNNNNLLDYQIISKVGKTYDRVFYEYDNGIEVETNFVNRAFAGHKGCRLYKQKTGKNPELVANHPKNTLIWNEHIDELGIELIDKQWYIDVAYKRLNDYLGVRI